MGAGPSQYVEPPPRIHMLPVQPLKRRATHNVTYVQLPHAPSAAPVLVGLLILLLMELIVLWAVRPGWTADPPG